MFGIFLHTVCCLQVNNFPVRVCHYSKGDVMKATNVCPHLHGRMGLDKHWHWPQLMTDSLQCYLRKCYFQNKPRLALWKTFCCWLRCSFFSFSWIYATACQIKRADHFHLTKNLLYTDTALKNVKPLPKINKDKQPMLKYRGRADYIIMHDLLWLSAWDVDSLTSHFFNGEKTRKTSCQ